MSLNAVNAITAVMTKLFSDLSKVKIKTSHISFWRKPGSEDETSIIEDSENFTYDLIRGSAPISTIHPRSQIEGEFNIGHNAKVQTEDVFENVVHPFAFMFEDAAVSFNQTLKRLAGELAVTRTDKQSMGAIEKAQILLTRGVKKSISKMGGKLNLVASECIRTAKITLDNGQQYNFQRSSTNTVNVGITWDNVATAVPTADMVECYEAVRDNGRCTPWFIGMGQSAASAYFNTDEIKDLADSRRLNFISGGRELPALPEGGQRMLDNGWKYMAFQMTPEGYEFFIFVNSDNYDLANGSRVNFQPKGDVLMMDPSIRLDTFIGPDVRFPLLTPVDEMINRVFGISNMVNSIPPTMGDGIIEPWMFRHKTFVNEGETSIGIKSYNSSLIVPTQVDGAGALPAVVV